MSNYKIDLSVSREYASSNNLITIDHQSNTGLFEEVYKIAKYFKEELNYDSVPFSKQGMISKPYKALLFTERALDKYKQGPMPYRIYGACVFTLMKFKEDDDYWVLEWIWFHPFFRNRGNLKKNWKDLENEFGDFLIQKPISNDMNSFLKKIDSNHIII